MPDQVWPPPDKMSMHTYNGIGTSMMGHTRRDASGRWFATRWVTVLMLPVFPLDRFYLRRLGTTWSGSVTYSRTVTHYRIDGQSHRRGTEILRTYLFCWLVVPGFVLAPLLLLLSHADQAAQALGGDDGVFVLIGIVVGWLIGSVLLLAALLTVYRRRWAPVRAVHRLTERPATFSQRHGVEREMPWEEHGDTWA